MKDEDTCGKKNGQKRSYNNYKRVTFISEHSLVYIILILKHGCLYRDIHDLNNTKIRQITKLSTKDLPKNITSMVKLLGLLRVLIKTPYIIQTLLMSVP